MKYRVTTESGSVYLVDTDKQVMIRQPAEGGEQLAEDNEPLRFNHMLTPIENGRPLMVIWAGTKLRITTPVTEVVELDAP